MKKELYERLEMDVTRFDIEDVITTSGTGPGPDPVPGPDPDYEDDMYGVPLGF